MAPFSLQRQYFNRQKFRVMPLTTSSAGSIICSALLTKFAVTGCYDVHPGILRNKISTQQSTWMEIALEDGGSMAVMVEDVSGLAALGGGIGRWLKIAVAALGSNGSRRTCNDGIGISVIKARAYYYNIGISVSKDGERGRIRCKGRMLAVMVRR
jgi:hypothetical protein